ncbi:MAG: DNA translocase FtsK [Bacteriovoracia bacterium]
MRLKVLKIQLFLLFLLTLTTSVFVLYKDLLPDNYFLISSSYDSINFFTYGISSLLAFSGFLIGPWVASVFFFFIIMYLVLYVRRSYTLDTVNILPSLISFLGLTYLFYPNLIGEGLSHLLSKIEYGWIVAGTVISIWFLLWGNFRSAYISFLVTIYRQLKTLPKYCSVFTHFAKSLFSKNIIRNGITKSRPQMFLKLGNVLKGKLDFNKNFQKNEEEDEEQDLREAVSSRINQHNNIIRPQQFDKEEKTKEVEQNNIEVLPVVETENKVRKDIITPQKNIKKSVKSLRNLSKQSSRDLIDCLVADKSKKAGDPHKSYFEDITTKLEEKLAEFKIEASIINVLKGPVVDTFELELGPGVKVAKVTGMNEDLSLALSGVPIRIVHPMRGRTTIGIEVPRNPREIIYLDEVLASDRFLRSDCRLPIAMGKDAFGDISVVDLAKMPHMLVAGATGSGKSVFINTLLVSLLVKLSPEKMKLILIDPKQLELALYANLPHLLLPVVTEAKMAATALLWVVQEMERRYSILKEMRVRNIEGYNQRLKTADDKIMTKVATYFEDCETDSYELPYIVVIVDEFADLILTKMGKEIENNICRLAAKARAAGIHLVLATQRPSVDVITGLIKSNFPTRVSFRVTSAVDSRTILNTMGGERLLGNGDMLYKHGVEMTRVHSAFVDEKEIEVFAERLLEDGGPQFDKNALEFVENGGTSDDDSDISMPGIGGSDTKDELFDDAVRIVYEYKQASASMLQRRLKIGYNRAANLIEVMEAKGIVGPQQGSKPREVLANEEVMANL